jgi:hypothetical protein
MEPRHTLTTNIPYSVPCVCSVGIVWSVSRRLSRSQSHNHRVTSVTYRRSMSMRAHRRRCRHCELDARHDDPRDAGSELRLTMGYQLSCRPSALVHHQRSAPTTRIFFAPQEGPRVSASAVSVRSIARAWRSRRLESNFVRKTNFVRPIAGVRWRVHQRPCY